MSSKREREYERRRQEKFEQRVADKERSRAAVRRNVVVAALLWDGVPRQLLATAAGDPFITLVSSPALLAELARVLSRSHLGEKIRVSGKTVEEMVSLYARLVSVVTPRHVARVVVSDADDDQVIAVAMTAGASIIVTGDRAHLIPIGEHAGMAIVTARAALDLLLAEQTTQDGS